MNDLILKEWNFEWFTSVAFKPMMPTHGYQRTLFKKYGWVPITQVCGLCNFLFCLPIVIVAAYIYILTTSFNYSLQLICSAKIPNFITINVIIRKIEKAH